MVFANRITITGSQSNSTATITGSILDENQWKAALSGLPTALSRDETGPPMTALQDSMIRPESRSSSSSRMIALR
jgi:hypothetical protein